MMTTMQTGKILPRDTTMALLHAALESGEFRFARQVALAWLSAFPGDLEVSLLQAQANIAEGRPAQVVPALELVCRKDPFCVDAYRLLARAVVHVDEVRRQQAETSLFALTGKASGALALWGEPLRAAYQAIQSKQYAEAGRWIEEAFKIDPNLQLTAVLHLLVDRATQPALAVSHLAQIYANRWPDCLIFNLVLAEACLETGSEPEAVRLLHLCAANDSAGQVATRLLGKEHRFHSLWPEEMVIHFDLPVPAAVAGHLGWNRLTPGELRNQPAQTAGNPPQEAEPAAPQVESEALLDVDPASLEVSVPGGNGKRAGTAGDALHKVESEFERLAKKLKQPALARADGRFPVYVILSTRAGLAKQYGPQSSGVLDGEMQRMAGLVKQRNGWTALVYYPDDAACTAQYNLTPVDPSDPWKLKLALVDLDGALARRGEMVGALLIVGGDTVVPFHRLPNPTDDSDGEVLSDNPYMTLDSNYFVPEWPSGRLVGESGPDAGLLLEQLRGIQRWHGRRRGRFAEGWGWLMWMRAALAKLVPSRTQSNFGYTAAVWRRSSLAVFRPIGAPHTVVASPPAYSGSLNPAKITAAGLGYYNLHGLEDSPSWYGQRDPQEKTNGPDYPVALSPEDLHRNGRAPRFVFSEACYGGFVEGKGENDSLALKFLSIGTQGLVASTCTSYGSVSTPLVAADLLGHLFWQHMKGGRPAGEALMQAKVDLVREMTRRQGFLDGEDQKTLISFVLYGDPLAGYDGFRLKTKAAQRSKAHASVATVSDRIEDGAEPVQIAPEVLAEVKKVAAEYLPGADLADFHGNRQQTSITGGESQNQSTGISKNGRLKGTGWTVVTVSKQVQIAHHTHRHYLRVTLDEHGKTVKLAISR